MGRLQCTVADWHETDLRDYSLHAVASRPAKVGEMLITTSFSGGTRGFAAEGEANVAVCLLPGTELAFDQDVRFDQSWIWKKTTNFRVARFRKIDQYNPVRHHDALELPDGNVILVTLLSSGQRATVLQLPVTRQPEHTTPTAEGALKPQHAGFCSIEMA
jgi:hypothetical protein